jgi:hypothetical protein
MDQTVCKLSGFDCNNFTKLCQRELFDDPSMITYVESLGPSFCSMTNLDVYLPCGSVDSFGKAIDVVTKGLDVKYLQDQYTESNVRQCAVMATALPSLEKIRALYKSKNAWLVWLAFGLALLGAVLAIVPFKFKYTFVNIIGLTMFAGGSLLGFGLATNAVWKF